jgi:hypothetical protein
MACPWFSPRQPLANSGAGPAPRAPLGELWSGLCCAPGYETESVNADACNTGYARSRCPRFPPDTPHDAVRFHVASENGDLIHLHYIYEKQWWPGDHGTLDYSRSLHAIEAATGTDVLRQQAAAFAASWIRKTTEER